MWQTSSKMSIRAQKYAWDTKMRRKRTVSESEIDGRPYRRSKKVKKVPAGSQSRIKAKRVASVGHISHSTRRRSGTGLDYRTSIRRAESAPADAQIQAAKKCPDFYFLQHSSEKRPSEPNRNEESNLGSTPVPTGANDSLSEPLLGDIIVAPLTRQALNHLNRINGSHYSDISSSTSSEAASEMLENFAPDEPKGTINAYNQKYIFALEDKGISFADDEPDNMPSNLDELTKAIFAAREVPEPDDEAARTLRILMRNAPNESAIVQNILPEIIPIKALEIDKKTSTAPDQLWHRKIMIDPNVKPFLTTIKPNRTIGWSRRVFGYPNAVKHLDARMCPVAGNSGLAWAFFTVEVKGERRPQSSKTAELAQWSYHAIELSVSQTILQG